MQVRQRRAARPHNAGHSLLLAESSLWRAIPHVLVQRMPWLPRGSSMLGISMTASGFSIAANALASPTSPQWATGGTVRRVASRSYALASIGAHTAPSRSNREVCMSGRTSVFWGSLLITRPCESRGRVMLESTDHASIAFICGGNAETDSLALVVGQLVDCIADAERSRGHHHSCGAYV